MTLDLTPTIEGEIRSLQACLDYERDMLKQVLAEKKVRLYPEVRVIGNLREGIISNREARIEQLEMRLVAARTERLRRDVKATYAAIMRTHDA